MELRKSKVIVTDYNKHTDRYTFEIYAPLINPREYSNRHLNLLICTAKEIYDNNQKLAK